MLKTLTSTSPVRRRRAVRVKARPLPSSLAPIVEGPRATSPGPVTAPPLASHKIPPPAEAPVLIYVEPGPRWLSFVPLARQSDVYYLLMTLTLLGLLLLGRGGH